MTGQMLQEKLAAQLALNNNAFALIVRGDEGYPRAIYPLPATSVQALYDRGGALYLRFLMANGKFSTFPYGDILHLRQDFCENELFGESPMGAIAPLMEVAGTTDKGIIRAIQNSGVIQWLLKYHTPLRPEDLRMNAEAFAENFLSIHSKSIGVAASDSKAEAIRIEPKDYVPNAAQMDRTTQRIMAFFGTNHKIVMSSYSEDDWISYYEAEVEPTVIQMAGEFSRKLFSRRERGFGNRIYFETSSLQFASMRTKLSLMAMVDRGALVPNEWRAVFGLSPVPGGDKPIRRLDTQPVLEKEEEDHRTGD